MSLPLAGLLSRLFRRSIPPELAAAARGDADAIGRFYDAHVDGLYAFVFYRVGRDPALAEDIVQDTFTRALGQLGDYDPARGGVGGWLTTLSRNVIRDHLRAHHRTDAVAERWERIDVSLTQLYDALERAPLPGEVLARAETRDLVNMTIAHLPEQYRVALARKYVDDRSLEDLASELGLSVDAAKSLLARARRAFKETFSTLGHALEEVTP
ncbi:MAG TPA: sigma-70 family RNA polymerase sigma factor [Kofleriaceae bacterium]|jgi:RNA polymerase sigma-70 factor (ECF subfamily)|nr:sigma-70 family RNA polymerase sigma factor [Kofleriaceae bacterium]